MRKIFLAALCMFVFSQATFAFNEGKLNGDAFKSAIKNADITGLKLGMSAAEAEKVIRNKFASGKVDPITRTNGESAGIAGSLRDKSGTNESITAEWMGGKVFRIYRSVHWSAVREKDLTGTEVSYDDTLASLKKKYGAMAEFISTSDRDFWVLVRRNGQALRNNGGGICATDSRSTSSNFSSDAELAGGISVTQGIGPMDKFVSSIVIVVTDCAYAYNMLNMADQDKDKQNEAARKQVLQKKNKVNL